VAVEGRQRRQPGRLRGLAESDGLRPGVARLRDLGGSADDAGLGIVVDAAGNATDEHPGGGGAAIERTRRCRTIEWPAPSSPPERALLLATTGLTGSCRRWMN